MTISKQTKKEIFDWVIAIVAAVLLSFLIRQYIFQPSQVKMSSMFPTLKENEIILVNKLTYKLREPQRGDIIVFQPPNSQEHYVKRIIGLPGEEIEIRNGGVYINQERVEEPYISVETDGLFNPTQLSDNEYFVMGDNRQNSMDSRAFGPISSQTIVGKAILVYWPLQEIKSLSSNTGEHRGTVLLCTETLSRAAIK